MVCGGLLYFTALVLLMPSVGNALFRDLARAYLHANCFLETEVTCITSSPSKVEAIKGMGADRVIVSSDEEAMKAASKSLVSFIATLVISSLLADNA